MNATYSARCLVEDRHVIVEAETRTDLVTALKDVSPGGISWIKHGSVVLEDDQKWSILAEARELRLNAKPSHLKPRTKAFALDIIRLYSDLPSTTVAQVLGKQLLRSGTSVGANYREACRARSNAEFIAKCGDCLKELEESRYWMELLQEARVAKEPRLKPLLQECQELSAMFVASINTARRASPKRSSPGEKLSPLGRHCGM